MAYMLPEPRKEKVVGKAFSDEEEKQIAEAYREDEFHTHTSLGEELGVNGGTIRNICLRQGVKSRPLGARGERHGRWKGGISRIDENGYERVSIPATHPFAAMRSKSGKVRVHRLRMAEHLGRPLRKGETVHHIDGDKLNNDLSNLQLRTKAHGSGIVLRCETCGSTNFKAEALA